MDDEQDDIQDIQKEDYIDNIREDERAFREAMEAEEI